LQQALRSEFIVVPPYGGYHQSRALWVRILYYANLLLGAKMTAFLGHGFSSSLLLLTHKGEDSNSV